MNKLDTCQGCYVNPNWNPNGWDPNWTPNGWNPSWNPAPLLPTPLYPVSSYPVMFPSLQQPVTMGLTNEEQEILGYLKNAYRVFVELDVKHPDDDDEFRKAIHDAQKMIALRAIRRIDPHIWHQPKQSDVH